MLGACGLCVVALRILGVLSTYGPSRYQVNRMPKLAARPLRVAHMPTNTASLPVHTARAQREAGIDARVFEFGYQKSPLVDYGGVEWIQLPASYRSLHGIQVIARYARIIAWADVVHWYSASRLLPRELDFRILRMFDRPRVVEWMGSDIRRPSVELADNPVFARAVADPALADLWSDGRSSEFQRQFHVAGFLPVCATGMLQYVEEEYLGELCAVDRALPLDDYEPSYPRADRSVPLIVHAPSHMLTKGTVAVLRAIDRLAGQLSFDVDLVHGVPRAEALRRMQRCDIFIDQLIVGDFGMAALEAMALGKPVVAYVKPSLRERYPSELPVVDATPESLESVLRSLLTDPAKRTELGRLGRRFVEEHADARSRAVRLTEVYGAARSRARRGSVHD